MNTIQDQPVDGRRRRRTHSPEFKAQVVEACRRTGASIASVAMTHGINANLARRWVIDAEQCGTSLSASRPAKLSLPASPPGRPAFMPLQVPPTEQAADIRIEVRRGSTAVNVAWPTAAAAECAAWLRELLR